MTPKLAPISKIVTLVVDKPQSNNGVYNRHFA